MEKEPEGRDIYFCKYDNLIPVESLLGLETPDKLSEGRDTGRTFRIMLLTLHAASANPGHWIQIKDHAYGSDNYLDDYIAVTLKRMHMDHLFQFHDTYPRDSHKVRSFFIRYSPRDYSNNSRYKF